MIKENIKFCDEFTSALVKELETKNIGEFVTLFPMLRKEKDKLLLGTLIEINNEDLLKREKVVRPKYWVIVDNDNYHIKVLNETKFKDYMDCSIIPTDKEFEDKFFKEKKEIIKYEVNKRIKYNNYFINDIKEDIINSEVDILNAVNNTIIVDNKKVNATDYLIANVEEEIKKQVEDIIALIIKSKYSSIIYYYQTLIEDILSEYKITNNINVEKMQLAATILDKYYGEVYGIKYFFNI